MEKKKFTNVLKDMVLKKQIKMNELEISWKNRRADKLCFSKRAHKRQKILFDAELNYMIVQYTAADQFDMVSNIKILWRRQY